jgi:tripartite tricarboxylate transporter TctB family protein
MKSKGHLYFGTFLILVSGYAIFAASQWSFKTGFFPLAVAIPLLGLTLLHFYLELFGAPERNKGPAVEAEFSNEVPPEVARRRVITMFSWMAAFILAVYLVGFPLTVPLFVFFFLKFQSEVSWTKSIGLTGITWMLFYGLFQWLVRIQFEAGAIQSWLGM